MMGVGIVHGAYCPVDLGGSVEQGVVHTPEFPGDEGLRVTRGLTPGQPCSEPWLEADRMFLHRGTVETAQAQRKLWGFFSPVSQFISRSPFCLQQPQALCGVCSSIVVLSHFSVSFPSQT